MAERPIICVGDTTSHGGTILEGFPTLNVYGRLASGMGHKVRCPRCKGIFSIIEGAENRTVNGIPIALEGMLTSCGAALVASQRNARVAIDHTAAAGLAFGPAVEGMLDDHHSDASPKDYDQHFEVLDEVTGQPMANRRYRITVDGLSFEGVTDSEGRTQRILAKDAMQATLEVLPGGG